MGLVVASLGGLLGSCGVGEPGDVRGPSRAAAWGASTEGGRGGRILRVSTLASAGRGSLRAAVEAEGRRVVVFEVGGVIDLEGWSIRAREPYLTIAGETAPSPGVTVLRGGLRIETHDVVARHLRIRPGEAGHGKRSGWEVDAITVAGREAHDVVVEHCSLSWATDENLTATGPQFAGQTPTEWRRGTSRRITFRNNIVAEGLSESTHGEGEHSKGTLIYENVTEVTITGNLYAHNMKRNPYFKGGTRGVVANNVIYNAGRKAVQYALGARAWDGRPYEEDRLAVVGNVMKLGPNTTPGLPLVSIDGVGPVELFVEDNLVLDRLGRAVEAPLIVRDDDRLAREAAGRFWSEDVALLTAAQVFDQVLGKAGARPWDRDEVDQRIIQEVRDGAGRIIDSEEEVGGYPRHDSTHRPFEAETWNHK